MSDVKRLLAEATPLPWDTDGKRPVIHTSSKLYLGSTFDDHVGLADAALIVYAVNHLPDYLAAVEALEWLVKHAGHNLVVDVGWIVDDDFPEGEPPGVSCVSCEQVIVLTALARLRDEVPA